MFNVTLHAVERILGTFMLVVRRTSERWKLKADSAVHKSSSIS